MMSARELGKTLMDEIEAVGLDEVMLSSQAPILVTNHLNIDSMET
jgi:hypothetical protein